MNVGTCTPLPGSVEYWARETPRAPALWERGRVTTFADLDGQADRLAELLASQGGVGRDDRVAVCMTNRSEWFVSQAAIAKLDAQLVPIAWRLTPAETHYIVADSAAKAFIFDAPDLHAMARVWTNSPACEKRSQLALVLSVQPSLRHDVVTLSEIISEGEAPRRLCSRPPRSIVYTSGTTGRPRGVLSASRPDAGKAQRRSAGSRKRNPALQRNLLGAPLNHAAGQASARATLSSGGCVYLMPRFDPEEALRIIDGEKVTMSFMVPTMLNRIVNLPRETLATYDVSSIQLLTTGASPCPHWVKQRVIEHFGDHCLMESYGATEIGLVTRMLPRDQLRKPGSCGRVLDNVEVRIVGEDGGELPTGEVGEICVRTPVMIERYLNEAPLREDPNAYRGEFFKTGDVGRLDDEGFLYILDRKKDMIIAGGVNIYPAEIENALREHPAVLDAAAFGVPHEEWGEEVRAVVECVPGQTVGEGGLLAFVSERLAGYKRPRSIEVVPQIPRNAAGKTLKTDLRRPHWEGTGKTI